MRSCLPGLLLAGCLSSPAPPPSLSPTPRVAWTPNQAGPQEQFQVRLSGSTALLEWPESLGKASVFRSTGALTGKLLNNPRAPIVALGSTRRDAELASGVDYHYMLVAGDRYYLAGPVRLPESPLPTLSQPRVQVDKGRYLLKLLDGDRVVKRYPIAMGTRSGTRKLCYDNASTPEGRYRIYNQQPEATYYRAYDIDYPNPVDQARYQLLAPGSDIGGEIQIHGRGIRNNWTFGCMALRDEDMDELFSHPEISQDTPVWIYGGELTLEDLQADSQAPDYDPLELGRKQRAQGLPVTCLRDAASRKAGL